MNFEDLIPVTDVFYHILTFMQLETIISLLKSSKTCKIAIEHDRLWEILYKKHFIRVGHTDLSLTWSKSYSETYTLILSTSKELIKELLLIDSKYLNKSELTRDVFAKLVFYMSEMNTWKIDEGRLIYIGDGIGDLIMFLDGTINESENIKLDDVNYIMCAHERLILDLFSEFGFDME